MRKQVDIRDQKLKTHLHCNFRRILRDRPFYLIDTAASFSQVLVVACESEVDFHEQHVSKLWHTNFEQFTNSSFFEQVLVFVEHGICSVFFETKKGIQISAE